MAANTAFVALPVVHVSDRSSLRARGPYPVDTVKGVVSRVLGPKYVDMFQYDVIPADITMSHDVFEVPELAGKPLLKGNTGVSITCKCFHFLP